MTRDARHAARVQGMHTNIDATQRTEANLPTSGTRHDIHVQIIN